MSSTLEKIKAYREKSNNYIKNYDFGTTSALDKIKAYREANPYNEKEDINYLMSKKKRLETQLSNYDRKEKVEWWSDDNNFLENVGNVLYKTFIERQPTKYEEDENYNKLKSEYDEVNSAIQDYKISNTNYEKGFFGGVQKVADTITGNAMSSVKGMESSVNKLAGLPTNSNITYSEKLAQKAREETTGIGRVGLDLVGSFTRMLPQILAPNPITATAIGFANYGGSAYNEAKREGADETRATIYGLTIGSLEMAMSKILGGFESVYGKSALGKLSNKVLGNVIKNPTLRKTISGATGEFTEEYLQEFLEPIVRNTILQEENGADFWNTMKDDIGEGLKQLSKQFFNMENLYAGLLGGLSSSILQLPNNIAQSKFDYQSQIDSSNINSNQNTIGNANDSFNSDNTPKTVYDLVQQEQNSQNNANLPIIDNSQNDIVPYTQHEIENFKNGKVKVVQNESDISSFVDTASKVPSNAKLYFGKLGKKIANKIKQTLGINLENYNISLSTNAVRHTYKNHGKLEYENNRGQVPITSDDFKLIPQIVTNYDNVRLSGTTENNNSAIVFEKRIGDNYYLVSYVSNKNHNLEVKTMWKIKAQKKNSATASDALMPQSLTSETDSGTSSLYVNDSTNLDNSQIMQSSNNINMQNQSNNTRDIKVPTQEDIRKTELKNTKLPTRKTLNPAEISNLTKEDANTTPILQNANVSTGNGKSKFASNIRNKTNMLNEDSKNAILSDEDVSYYREVTNEESLNQAFERLNTNGKSEVERWFRQESENADSIDVAEGWILLKQYQDQISKTTDLNTKNELNHSMVQVAKKLRDMGTKAGQTVQAFNILNRLTPEGMVYYAQSELDEAFQRMVKNKSQNWINKYKSDFELTPQETQFILDTMQEVSQMQDGYDKRVKLAEIQKVMTDKLPPQKGAGIKAWMRISMLFNPKTQVRNVVGNALIAPVNSFSDLIGSIVDKRLAKSTNVRTTGTTSLKNYGKGFKKGLFESYNDLKKGINTRNIEGNRFEISQGKSFNDNTKIGKALNRVDNFLSFMLDAGDRGFYEASFVNSINNQMVLNNTTEVTQDMIDIATSEALQRTWQDNNNYTRFVMNIRRMMNMGKEYGLGDILIPFAKTPANLTKAIVDYSPVGLINSINKGIRFKRSLTNGQFTPQLQHDFVQTLGKATAGTMLYILGYALAKAGITSGESDDDKDVSNFLKNTLGVNSYSIKIGDKTFTYDWAQPLAAPLAITANMVQKEKEGASLLENITSSLDEGFNVVLEQSFFESINNVFSDTGSVPEKLWEEVLGLPSRAIPTFFKQITDMVDGTQRTSFEYDKPLETAINKVKAKIPFLSQTLSPSVDTLGRDIQKYGGNNNIFNVFFNPANVSTENISESASEIYRLYKETGDKTIMPRVAPYYINQDGNKITLSASEKAEYQSISGQIIEDNVKDLLDNEIYNAMSDENKAEIINKIVNFSYNKAREEVLNIPMSDEYNKINMYISDGGTSSDYYINKEEIDYSYENPAKYSTITQITTYSKYQNYNDAIKDIKEQYEDSNQRKYAVINYVNGLNLSIPQKAMLIKMNYNSFDNYDNQIIEYINSQNMTIAEKTEILEQLGFTVRNGRVYS